jgi:tRNA (guanine26-N2/guanine27-N2)-dimethyltransferase
VEVVNEGAANIEVGDAFYNPKMRKLRDISVLFLRALDSGNADAKLLDATTATGVRAIRYAKEAGIGNVTMIDINPDAAEIAKRNAKSNRVKAKVMNKSIQELSSIYDNAFDIIDVDPFGTPVPMIHDVLKVSKNNTTLMITATDTATLCGAEGSACFRIYSSRPIHNELCHEAGIRILINYVAREAAQFNFGIEPLLSISDMHYMRIFLRLRGGSKEAVLSLRNSGFGAYCNKCHSFSWRKGIIASLDLKCGYCKSEMVGFGPLWLGQIHDRRMVERMMKLGGEYDTDVCRLIGKISEELDSPFYYSIPKITSYLKSASVPLDGVLERLRKKHSASRTHFEENAIKTDADISEVIKAIKKGAGDRRA